jgi:hypothetical protein
MSQVPGCAAQSFERRPRLLSRSNIARLNHLILSPMIAHTSQSSSSKTSPSLLRLFHKPLNVVAKLILPFLHCASIEAVF